MELKLADDNRSNSLHDVWLVWRYIIVGGLDREDDILS